MDVFTSMALTCAPNEDVAIGGATMVWVDLTTNKSAPWPEHILQKIS
jgi:acyl-CoA thioester hydrolase